MVVRGGEIRPPTSSTPTTRRAPAATSGEPQPGGARHVRHQAAHQPPPPARTPQHGRGGAGARPLRASSSSWLCVARSSPQAPNLCGGPYTSMLIMLSFQSFAVVYPYDNKMSANNAKSTISSLSDALRTSKYYLFLFHYA